MLNRNASLLFAGLAMLGLIAASGRTQDNPAKEPAKKDDLSKQIEDALKELDKPAAPDPNVFPGRRFGVNPLNPNDVLRRQLEVLKQLGADDAAAKMQIELLQKQLEVMQRLQPGIGGAFQVFPNQGVRAFGAQGRLGLRLTTAPAVVLDQLNLPAERGLVVVDVTPNSAAEKAGFKVNDIILEFAGHPVPNSSIRFSADIRERKAGEKVDAVIVRRGKKETLKDIVLPEAQADDVGRPLVPFPNIRIAPKLNVPLGALNIGGDGNQSVAVEIVDDTFSVRADTGNVKITIKGTRNGDAPAVARITILEGDRTTETDSVDKVPEAHREKVQQLLRQIRF